MSHRNVVGSILLSSITILALLILTDVLKQEIYCEIPQDSGNVEIRLMVEIHENGFLVTPAGRENVLEVYNQFTMQSNRIGVAKVVAPSKLNYQSANKVSANSPEVLLIMDHWNCN